jgi:hypothetical protein
MGNYENMDGDLNSIKLKIPNFQGKNDSKGLFGVEEKGGFDFQML